MSVAPAQPTVRTAPRVSRRPFVRRAVNALLKHVRLVGIRMWYPRAQIGRRADIRRRFCLRQAAGARVSIGERCILDNDCTLQIEGVLTIGDRTIFGHHCTVAAVQEVEIGEDCLIAELVSIRDNDHRFALSGVPFREQGHRAAPVRIGRNVWLGAKVTVVKGVTIGDNVVVGANAVVTKDIPANSVAVGIPARVIRTLA